MGEMIQQELRLKIDPKGDFEFCNHRYSIEDLKMPVLSKGDYASINEHGEICIAHSFYDGGCDMFEAIQDELNRLQKIFEENQHRLPCDPLGKAQESGKSVCSP